MRRRHRGRPKLADQAHTHRLSLRQAEILHFSGPIPSPAMLRAYEEVIANGAERVFRMAEAQGRHRRMLETITMIGAMLLQLLGLTVGASLCAGLGYGGWVLAREGHSLFGIAAIIVALGTPASVFVFGLRRQAAQQPSEARLSG